MRFYSLILCALLPACGKDDDSGTKDTASQIPAPAPLATLSSGECPDLTTSGISTFLSSGEERRVAIFRPAEVIEGLPVVFFFHGLVDTTYDPISDFSSALAFQARADASNFIIVVPESRTMSVYGMVFYMWEVMNLDEKDLVLYDDLRTCVSDGLGVDLTRTTAMGFSGGALFTTVLARERGDTLAAIAEFSGGSDAESGVFENTVSAYGTPAYTMPALLGSGGTSDVWPDPSFYVINFETTTDSLQAALLADEHFVVRCRHTLGHTITLNQFADGQVWLLNHQYGYPSPYLEQGIAGFEDWCEVAEPAAE